MGQRSHRRRSRRKLASGRLEQISNPAMPPERRRRWATADEAGANSRRSRKRPG